MKLPYLIIYKLGTRFTFLFMLHFSLDLTSFFTTL